MKKFLFTCFLALPCLPVTIGMGSPPFLSLVAQSPGADSLPTSIGPHRGGETLSDTFTQVDYGAKVSSPANYTTSLTTLDGGPMLRTSDIGHRTSLPSSVSRLPSLTNFGLINPDQDMGAGEGTPSLQPAPFPVFSGQINSGREAYSQSTEAQSLASCFACAEPSRSMRLASSRDSLRIGDPIPDDLVFTQVLQSDAKEIRLSDFRGKYLILQFWATWCTASSGFLLQAEEIHQHFGDRIQVLPVTYESKEKVEKFLALRKSLAELHFPLITDESRLRNYFPHLRLPHLILIDPEGKVRAITGAEDMSIAKLSTLMDTGVGSFRLKQDRRVPVNLEENLISGNTQLASKNIRFQSALTHYIPGVDGASMENLADGTHLLFVNTSLIKLYRHAYTGRDLPNYLGFNRILSEGFEEEELTTSKSGLDYQEWMEKGDRVFGYELIAPPGVDGYALMREDLRRFFPHIEAKVEQRPRMVWALVQQEGKSYPRSTSTKSYQVQPGTASLRNSLLTGFIYQLNLYFMQRSPYPVMDRTGIDYPIDIDLEANFSKPEELKAALNQTGLDLVLREESIPVLILTKRNPQNPINP